MLSALAVSTSGKPGPGFAGLARDLGQIEHESVWESFWQNERKKVYKCWAQRRD